MRLCCGTVVLDESVVEGLKVRCGKEKVPCEGGFLLMQLLSAHVVARVESAESVDESGTSCEELVSLMAKKRRELLSK